MLEKLASAQGIRNEQPNIALAIELSESRNIKAIKEIALGLTDKNQHIAHDCIKVMYEIGFRRPSLIADYADIFLKLLNSRSNRLVWGAMTALSQIADLKPQEVFAGLDNILKAYQTGSVITVDTSISVLAKLAQAQPAYAKRVWPLVIKHLETCRPKEVGQHAERAFIGVNPQNAGIFKKVLLQRRDALSEPQKKRVDKLLKRMEDGTYEL